MIKKTFIPLILIAIVIAVFGVTPCVCAEEKEMGNPAMEDGTRHPSAVNSRDIAAAVERAQQALNQIRDPFAPTDLKPEPETQVSAQPVLPTGSTTLEGLGLGGNNAYAVIGGEVFYLGEEKNGIKLVAVRKGEADIIVNGEETKIRMISEDEIKKAQGRRSRNASMQPVSSSTTTTTME